MKTTQDISVIMPAYNAANYIKTAIESVLNQSFDNFELIIINDGSQDNTIDIISEFDDDRISIVNNCHNFIGSLNIGLQKASGKYIARMDADDLMLPERLSAQYTFMEEHKDIDVCGTWAECFGAYCAVMRTMPNNSDILCGLLWQNALIHPTVMIRNQSLINYNLKYDTEYLYAEDYKLWIDFVMHGAKFANIQCVHLKYFCGDSQVTSKFRAEMEVSKKKAQQLYIEYVMSILSKTNDEMSAFINNLYSIVIKGDISIYSFITILKCVYNDWLSRQQ